MHYQAELQFVQKLLKSFFIHTEIISSSKEFLPELPMEMKQMIYGGFYKEGSFEEVDSHTIYRIRNQFECHFIFFQLPDCPEERYFLIGPYLQKPITKAVILKWAEQYGIPFELFSQLEKYYTDLPVVLDDSTLFAVVNTLGEKMWGSLEHFSLQTIHPLSAVKYTFSPSIMEEKEMEEPILAIRTLEERYANENEIMRAVSQGLMQKTKIFVPVYTTSRMEQRLTDSVRNMKNYMIILNTILRKAAENGAVHPLYIDQLSSRYAQKIEVINSRESCSALAQDMLEQYTLLVKKHSMKGYSFLVSQVIVYIDSDLSADLSLKAQAARLNVNASYLSTLFKKETGKTLTEYVNGKRMKYATDLLLSTNLQVQVIAQHCGIVDVNYFTKMFKKHVGVTPKEFRSRSALK